MAVAVYNHYKRVATDTMDDIEIEKSNMLMIGPTGPKLLSVPDLAEHTPGEIEIRFLQEAERLGVYGSDR